ncbi:MAG: MATE family efflux transporter [Clostridiales bacterium]|nr:MATE family efflux transporter [Clostridiales bacterium]
MSEKVENPLGTKPLGRLLFSLAVPAIVANVVNALYNIVDQIFIGRGVGKLGNAATSISFPLTTVCLALGLMIGLGASSGFSLELGRKNEEKARKIAGTAFGSLLICGVIIVILVRLFLKPMLIFFGSTDNILPYAEEYAGITSFGIPFLLFSMGANPLVRADRAPILSMMSILVGSIVNTILDPIFIFVYHWGMAGAAWATVIGQVIGAIILFAYIPKFKSVKFKLKDFIPGIKWLWVILKLGFNSFIFQFSMLIVQIIMNNVLNTYGEKSIYGADTPIAVAGIVTKINVIFISLIIGLINGAQPICGYNYGAKKYGRVRHTVRLFMTAAMIISVECWLAFELFPKPILMIFGSQEDALYFEFAVRFMRIFLFFNFVNGIQICSATFFPSIGKAAKGAILSFAKQVVLLIPLLLILPVFMGLDGVMFAQPITDLVTVIMSLLFLWHEFRHMPKTDEA